MNRRGYILCCNQFNTPVSSQFYLLKKRNCEKGTNGDIYTDKVCYIKIILEWIHSSI